MLRRTTAAALAAASAAAVGLTASPAMAAPMAMGSFTLHLSLPLTCTSTLTGTRSATAFTVTGATATGCGGAVVIQGLPWSGSFGPPALMSFSVRALSCPYSGVLGSGTVTGSPPTITFTGQPVSSTNPLCPAITVDATYTFA